MALADRAARVQLQRVRGAGHHSVHAGGLRGVSGTRACAGCGRLRFGRLTRRAAVASPCTALSTWPRWGSSRCCRRARVCRHAFRVCGVRLMRVRNAVQARGLVRAVRGALSPEAYARLASGSLATAGAALALLAALGCGAMGICVSRMGGGVMRFPDGRAPDTCGVHAGTAAGTLHRGRAGSTRSWTRHTRRPSSPSSRRCVRGGVM